MNDKIRVLHVIKTLSLGGAETNLLNLVGSFDPQRIESHVAYSFGGEIEQRFRSANLRLFKYADGSHRIKSLHTLPIVLRLAAYIRRQRIDVVQTHNFNAHVWGLLAAKLAGARVVEHVHDFRYTPAEELARRHGLLDQYRFIRHFRRRSDRIVVLTRDNLEYVVQHGQASPQEAVKIHNGMPFDQDTTPPPPPGLRARHAIPDDAIVIATSARMDPTKNIDLILRVAGEVARQAPRVMFLVAGSGEHLAEYKQRCTESGLDAHMRFIGFEPDIYGLLASSDIFLLPSFLELHSIAIMEAMKMKVPVVISSGVGCNDEFITHGENGFLCDPFDDRPWTDALLLLAADAQARRAIGARGEQTCRQLFDIRDTAARFERLYAELTPGVRA